MERNHPVIRWETPSKAILLNARTGLTLLAVLFASILTFYSSRGVLTVDGVVVKWKIFLFSAQLEAAVLVIIRDLTLLLVDFYLVFYGMTRSQLSHAMSHTITLSQVHGLRYKLLFFAIFLLGSIISPFLLSLVQVPDSLNSRNWIDAPNQRVSTNCLGGRIGENFGATGQWYLFNTSDEKYVIQPGGEHYAVYLKSGTSRQIFVPKIPQIGPYSRDCNSDENEDIIAAQVPDVEGLLYKCMPFVEERSESIEYFEPTFKGSAGNFLRLIEDRHQQDKGTDKALFNVTLAISKGKNSTVVLSIPCKVTAATATLDVQMNAIGVMGLVVVDDEVVEISKHLPDRVIGIDDNELELALENSIGNRGIGVVREYKAANNNLLDWDGLIRAVVAAYGIRSALDTTFADLDDSRLATNVKKVSLDRPEIPELRLAVLWTPIVLCITTRLLSLVFPTIFSGGLDQVLAWLGLEKNGKAAGRYYFDQGARDKEELVHHLNLEVRQDGCSKLGLKATRDNKIGLGSYRYVRKLTSEGCITEM